MDTSDILLTDLVAVVTGGAMGLGEGMALGMAKFGAHVVIADIDTQKGENVACAVRSLGRQALFVRTDMFESAAIAATIERARAELGSVDILINNAGGVRHSAFLDLSERNRRRHVDLNLMSVFAATEAAARVMIEGGRGGSIINIASIEAIRAAPNYSVYAASKAAMLSFTRSMALELSAHDIRVNAIAPDHIDTPGTRGRSGQYDTAQVRESRSRHIPLGRDGLVDDCAGAAVFLASRMASYITGATLHLDGGTAAALGWRRTPGGDWSLS